MNEPRIRFPVTCPQCGQETLGDFAVVDIAAALISANPLRLFAPCHCVYWEAGPAEIAQIREYLAADVLGAHYKP
jgi:hypothetical protein